MKKSSPHLSRLLGLIAALVGFTLTGSAQTDAGNVATPGKRQDDIDRAKMLVAPREIIVVANDPFHPAGFDELVSGMNRPAGSTASSTPGEAAPAQPTGPRNDRELLQAIGAALQPKGLVNFGGQLSLSFGQKRVKAGEKLTITFDGNEYTLVVTAITPPNFTLRLNREEFTRTIK